MNPALWAAKTGLDAQQMRMTVISNNLANVNTNGFKRDRAVFEDLLYQNLHQVGAQTSQDTQSPTGLHLGTGSRIVANEKLYTQGSLVQTGSAFDMAIEGRGFFQILLPDGSTGYTRNGSFKVDSQGNMVTAEGFSLQPPVTVPAGATALIVAADGTITANIGGQTAPQQIGTLQLTDFINPSGLQPRGGNLLLESVASGPPQVGTPGLNGLGSLAQGVLEASNVNVVEELVNMIETQRAYEMNSKAVSTTDRMLQYLTNNL